MAAMRRWGQVLGVLAAGAVSLSAGETLAAQPGEWTTTVAPAGPPAAAATTTAAPADQPKPKKPPRKEVSVGAAWAPGSAAIFSTLTQSGRDGILVDGWRIRSSTAISRVSYYGDLIVPGLIQTHVLYVKFKGYHLDTDVMGGFQKTLGPVVIKAFAGLAADGEMLNLPDASNPLQGTAWGVKGAIETWWTIDSSSYLALNAAVSTAHATESADARLGARIAPAISLGPEAGVGRDAAGSWARVGAFVRDEWAWGEASVSGGISQDGEGSRSGYALGSLLIRY